MALGRLLGSGRAASEVLDRLLGGLPAALGIMLVLASGSAMPLWLVPMAYVVAGHHARIPERLRSRWLRFACSNAMSIVGKATPPRSDLFVPQAATPGRGKRPCEATR